MAKYDWKQLEKEYILGDYKTVSEFLELKKISRNGNTQKKTKDWNDKKANKELKKSEKVIEKVIEKESEKEANNIVKVNDVANKLLSEVFIASNNITDKSDIKKLTSALKDLNDILEDKKENNNEITLADLIQKAYEKKVN